MQPLVEPSDIPLLVEAAIVGAGKEIFLACSNRDDRFEGFARLCQYKPNARPSWFYRDMPHTISSATLFRPPEDLAMASSTFAFLSEDGDVLHLKPGEEPETERITGSGLWSEDSKGWGSLAAIAQIGNRLYACGGGGQVYRRLAMERWEHIDVGLLGKDTAGGIRFEAIAGRSEREIYVGGWHKNVNDGVLCCWDGKIWISLAPNIPSISSIHVDEEGSVWACGRHGTLVRGNREDGFRQMLQPDRNRAFVCVASYEDQIYLSTETGLFLYDNGSAHRIVTGLKPEFNDGHILQVRDGELWAIGYNDIVRFDGMTWERMEIPH